MKNFNLIKKNQKKTFRSVGFHQHFFYLVGN